MNKIIINFLLEHVIKMKFLAGYRTAAGGAFFILTGAGTLCNEFATGVYDPTTTTQGLLMIGTGLGMIGIHGKLEQLLVSLGKGS